MKGRGGRGLGEVRGGLEGEKVREGSVTTVRTTVRTLHVIGVYTPVGRAHAHCCMHARAGAPYTFCVARKTRLPCSLQSPLALYIRHMGTPFELRAFAMAFGTFLARVQKSCFSKILEVPSFRRRVPWQSEPKNQFMAALRRSRVAPYDIPTLPCPYKRAKFVVQGTFSKIPVRRCMCPSNVLK